MSVETLWYTRCPLPTAFSAAVRLGWIDQEFARDKINIVSLLNSSSRAVRESHFAHTQPRFFPARRQHPAHLGIFPRQRRASNRAIEPGRVSAGTGPSPIPTFARSRI